MKTLELNAEPRAEFGKKATKLVRNNGFVPGVLYGNGTLEHFQIKEESLRALIYTPDVLVVKLNLAGKTHMCVLKEAQFHAVKDNTLHIDLYEVTEDKPVTVELPVKLNGLAAGVKAGGKLALNMRKLKVKGIYTNLPEKIELDVTELGLGKSIAVGSLHFENLEFMNPKSAPVCTVKATRAAAAAEATEEAAAE